MANRQSTAPRQAAMRGVLRQTAKMEQYRRAVAVLSPDQLGGPQEIWRYYFGDWPDGPSASDVFAAIRSRGYQEIDMIQFDRVASRARALATSYATMMRPVWENVQSAIAEVYP